MIKKIKLEIINSNEKLYDNIAMNSLLIILIVMNEKKKENGNKL
jgi:hypothetical protein